MYQRRHPLVPEHRGRHPLLPGGGDGHVKANKLLSRSQSGLRVANADGRVSPPDSTLQILFMLPVELESLDPHTLMVLRQEGSFAVTVSQVTGSMFACVGDVFN